MPLPNPHECLGQCLAVLFILYFMSKVYSSK